MPKASARQTAEPNDPDTARVATLPPFEPNGRPREGQVMTVNTGLVHCDSGGPASFPKFR
jgi:hypothetical protein